MRYVVVALKFLILAALAIIVLTTGLLVCRPPRPDHTGMGAAVLLLLYGGVGGFSFLLSILLGAISFVYGDLSDDERSRGYWIATLGLLPLPLAFGYFYLVS